MFLNTLHTAHKIFNLLTFTYLLNLLTCCTAKDHETSIEDSSAGFVIFFLFGVVRVLRIGLENIRLLYTCLLPYCTLACPPGAKMGGQKRSAREFALPPPHFQTPGTAFVWVSSQILPVLNCRSMTKNFLDQEFLVLPSRVLEQFAIFPATDDWYMVLTLACSLFPVKLVCFSYYYVL